MSKPKHTSGQEELPSADDRLSAAVSLHSVAARALEEADTFARADQAALRAYATSLRRVAAWLQGVVLTPADHFAERKDANKPTASPPNVGSAVMPPPALMGCICPADANLRCEAPKCPRKRLGR